jgi:hypothetical protein
LRAYDLGTGDAIIQANEVTFSNTGLDPSVALNSTSGTLQVDAYTINLSSGSFSVNGYQDVSLNALDGVVINGKGKFTTNGNLHTQSPFITATSASDYMISATGLLAMDSSGSTAPTTSGLGAKLTIDGSSVIANTRIDLSSGSLNLIAKSGNLEVGGLLSVAGNSKTFKDVIRYTDAGTITLISTSGNILLTDSSVLSVAAASAGGNAGTINVKSINGSFTSGGSLLGTASAKGRSGSFTLDTAYFNSDGPMSLTSLNSVLNTGKFFESRSFRVREGDVFIKNSIKSHKFSLAADSGSIEVSDSIDASGTTGGHISLAAHGSLTLSANAKLTARGNEFDNAGKGGSITLEAGNQRNGVIKTEANLILQTGSTIDLSVASATQSSESLGQFTGVLHLRAPRNSQNNDLAIASIGSAISDASNIIVEGVKIYDLTNPSSTIDKSTQNQIKEQASGFMGVGYETMENRLKSLQPALNLVISPGAEIINKSGDLILGSISSTPEEDWNLESYRFGPKGAPGTLTIRAAGDIIFYNSLSDGFKADPNASIGSSSMWLASLMDYNSQLKSNFQSWNFRITSGSDISSANYKEVFYETLHNQTIGSLKLGKDSGDAISSGNENALTSQQINNSYQIIRTGSGNIDINVAASLQLLNPLASIYTAGTILDNPTKVISDGDFMLPKLDVELNQYALGINQQIYAAQYTMAGGNINIHAGLNLERKTKNNDGLIDDSSRQLPNNWLYRRGKIDADGKYGKITFGSEPEIYEDAIASTTWWVDFSNFFQDIGALGGGNISLIAGQDVKNISASIPTNARAASGFASFDGIIELGGGDLDVAAGRNIDGGVYYVERGIGKIEAKSKITTNSTRSPSLGLLANLNDPLNPKTMLDANTWLPTTLFVGKSEFIVNASSDLLLGPVTNPFLLPQGLGNKFWYKTYFSTSSQTSQVTATSLGGDVTYRNAVTLRGSFQAEPILKIWHQQQHLISSSTAANRQPWLRITETNVDSFEPVWRLTTSNLSINSISGNVNLVGDFTLFPSAYGQLDIIAADSINGLQPTGISNIISSDKSADYWTYSTINISDADPSEFPTVTSPTTGNRNGSTISYESENNIFLSLYGMLTESGSFTGINSLIQTKQSRHSNKLHRSDNIPLHIYAENGNLSGINLFSSKMAKVFAGNDMVDLSLYIQNINPTDVTTVTSGRDINPYSPNSPLRIKAQTEGNTLPISNMPLAGDIQISGPGKLEVLAGRNLDLGIGGDGEDGTGTGITSIGNLRNPYLAAQGADIYVSAGIGPASSLSQSLLQYNELIEMFMATAEGNKYLDIISPGTDLDSLNEEERALLAVNVFQLLLRDAGRNFNNPESPFYGKWDNGWLAIKTLFPESTNWNGKILTQSRDIRTKMGGDINITVPGSGIVMSDTSLGNPLAPPGIITEAGGKVSLFTDESVDIGIGRIFTLQGGDITIWSSKGDIAAGSSSRTVQSAPPTRVIIDPQSASVQTDLAGLATGGGIGVLATVEGVKPGDVDLYAPTGVIDAGEAGIRVTGNINLGAVAVVNANNISAGGTSTGAPTTTVSAPSVSTISNASSAAAASSAPAAKTNDNKQTGSQNTTVADTPSIFTVEVIGYGGGTDDEEEKEKNNQNEAIQ